MHSVTGTRINLTNPRWSRSDVIATINCQDHSSGLDSPFCGCDIADGSGFETFFVSSDDNKAKYVKTITSNGQVEITIRDTAGNEAGVYSQDVNFIDKDAPEISARTQSGGDLSSIDRAQLREANLKITISDTLSGIAGYDIVIGDPSKFVDEIAFSNDCTSGTVLPASQTGALGTGETVDRNNVSTSQAIFVCARDAAGNISKRKLSFGGTRLINYYQGQVKGFSYSGEIGVSDTGSYEDQLVERIKDEDVSINSTYRGDASSRLSCQNTAIEKNIDIIARGRLNPHAGRQVIDDLSSNTHHNVISGTNQRNNDGIIYYSYETLGGNVDGDRGEIVELRGDTVNYPNWNDPRRGPYSAQADQVFQEIGIRGLKTVIVEGGNLYINADMYYEDPQSMVVFVVKRGTPSIH